MMQNMSSLMKLIRWKTIQNKQPDHGLFSFSCFLPLQLEAAVVVITVPTIVPITHVVGLLKA